MFLHVCHKTHSVIDVCLRAEVIGGTLKNELSQMSLLQRSNTIPTIVAGDTTGLGIFSFPPPAANGDAYFNVSSSREEFSRRVCEAFPNITSIAVGRWTIVGDDLIPFTADKRRVCHLLVHQADARNMLHVTVWPLPWKSKLQVTR